MASSSASATKQQQQQQQQGQSGWRQAAPSRKAAKRLRRSAKSDSPTSAPKASTCTRGGGRSSKAPSPAPPAQSASGSASSSPRQVAPAKRPRQASPEERSEPTMDWAGIRATRRRILTQGWAEYPRGLPRSWASWEVFKFCEEMHSKWNTTIVDMLEERRKDWHKWAASGRIGAAAAEEVTELLTPHGIAVYSPPDSQGPKRKGGWTSTGPRFYISITKAARIHWNERAPPPPPELHELLFGHDREDTGELRARGLGWTLAPPRSDPQGLHADIFVLEDKSELLRFPHILWKADPKENCTTQIVPGGFTCGDTSDPRVWAAIEQVSAPCVVVDSEVLHRGGPVSGDKWVSSLSLELCSPMGWAAWENEETGGTTKHADDDDSWTMLGIERPPVSATRPLRCPSPSEALLVPQRRKRPPGY
eukprot:TRINITY_DN3863_c0_g1_i1.p1 TRINITY_DN3863_c0_g1~~TRINITY_DN3863_c0_g1_i1.p1  ORF type:complete len:421 (+),score=71.87 TRINITY_DN3863_c0_g1_i1:96-1358(+)